MSQQARWPVQHGVVATLIRSFDWSRTPLGPPAGWPAHVRMAVDLCLGAGFPTAIWLGPALTQIYSDACIPLLRSRRPASFGAPAPVAWHGLWPTIGPLAEQVQRTGATITRGNNLPSRGGDDPQGVSPVLGRPS